MKFKLFNNIFLLVLLGIILFVGIFQSFYTSLYPYKESFENVSTSLGNYNKNVKYILIDYSNIKDSSNIIKKIDLFIKSNNNHEKIDLLNNSNIYFVDSSLSKVTYSKNECLSYGNINIGKSSDSNSKTVEIVDSTNVKILNEPNDTKIEDKFDIKIDGNKLTVTKTNDTNGWDYDLNLKTCSISSELNKESLNKYLKSGEGVENAEGMEKKIMIEFPVYSFKLVDLNKFIIETTDYNNFENSFKSISYYDSTKKLIHSDDISIENNGLEKEPFIRFVIYNESHYNGMLPKEYIFNSEYTSSNTYFQKVRYEIEDNKKKEIVSFNENEYDEKTMDNTKIEPSTELDKYFERLNTTTDNTLNIKVNYIPASSNVKYENGTYNTNDYYGSGRFTKNNNQLNDAQEVDFPYTKQNSDLMTQSSAQVNDAYNNYTFDTPTKVDNKQINSVLKNGELNKNTVSSDEINPNMNYKSSDYGESNLDKQYEEMNFEDNRDNSKYSYTNNKDVILPSDTSYTIGGSTGSNIIN